MLRMLRITRSSQNHDGIMEEVPMHERERKVAKNFITVFVIDL